MKLVPDRVNLICCIERELLRHRNI